jgi:hypothetical protein
VTRLQLVGWPNKRMKKHFTGGNGDAGVLSHMKSPFAARPCGDSQIAIAGAANNNVIYDLGR